MKTTIILASALTAALLAVPAFAETMLGCEVRPVEGSNYVVKVDPTCNFQIITGGGAEIDKSQLIDLIENGDVLPN